MPFQTSRSGSRINAGSTLLAFCAFGRVDGGEAAALGASRQSTSDPAAYSQRLVTLFRGARHRIWLKVPWFDASCPGGRSIFAAQAVPRRRGVDVRVVSSAARYQTQSRCRHLSVNG